MNINPTIIIIVCSIATLLPICILISVLCDISSIAKSLRIIAKNMDREN